jgi:hypothetical protein
MELHNKTGDLGMIYGYSRTFLKGMHGVSFNWGTIGGYPLIISYWAFLVLCAQSIGRAGRILVSVRIAGRAGFGIYSYSVRRGLVGFWYPIGAWAARSG